MMKNKNLYHNDVMNTYKSAMFFFFAGIFVGAMATISIQNMHNMPPRCNGLSVLENCLIIHNGDTLQCSQSYQGVLFTPPTLSGPRQYTIVNADTVEFADGVRMQMDHRENWAFDSQNANR